MFVEYGYDKETVKMLCSYRKEGTVIRKGFKC